MIGKEEANVVNCSFSQSFFVVDDKDNSSTPDTVFIDGPGEKKSFLFREDCNKYQQDGNQTGDASITAVITDQSLLKFWKREVPVAICGIHSCRACKKHVVK